MSLNVKLAMMVCVAFITGVSMIVGAAEPAERHLPSPLVAAPDPVPFQERLSEFEGSVDWPASDTEPSQRFARLSPIEQERARKRTTANRIEVVTPPISSDAEAVVHLPPVAAAVDRPVAHAAPESHPDAFEVVDTEFPPSSETAIAALADEVLTPRTRAGATPVLDAVAEEVPVELMKVSTGATHAMRGPARHEVKKGDTLVRIARTFWGADDDAAIDRLMRANPGIAKRGGKLHVGDVVIVPDESTPIQPPRTVRAERRPAAKPKAEATRAPTKKSGRHASRGGAHS